MPGAFPRGAKIRGLGTVMTFNRIFRGKTRREGTDSGRREPEIAPPPPAKKKEPAEASEKDRASAPEPPRRGSGIPRSLKLPAFAAGPEAMRPAPSRDTGGNGRLVVGPDILFKGEIASCDTLVVQGRVEASITSRVIEVAETGAFTGEARVEAAEIGGRFDGMLRVRNRLVVRPRGRIDGTVRYGEIEIQPGGRIGGDVRAADDGSAGD